ncbi:MAG TPA: hypothetical protein VLM91_16030 [Candidatus Methylomirabilis sp.]|nr:hypothetical protein [Candidatus Methylomirabilis sp.]
MQRIQLRLDERTCERVRRQARQKGCSISSFVRELLVNSLVTTGVKRELTIEEFTFIGAGQSRQGRMSAVSQRHDDALAEAILKDHRR